MHRVGTDLPGDPHDLDPGITVHDVQSVDPVGEVGEQSREVGRACPGTLAPQGVVDHEQRDHPVRARADGLGECRIVVQAKVAAEPHDGGWHPSILRAAWESCTT